MNRFNPCSDVKTYIQTNINGLNNMFKAKTLTERILEMNVVKTDREARLLINSGRVKVSDYVVTNEDYLVYDSDEVTVLPNKEV